MHFANTLTQKRLQEITSELIHLNLITIVVFGSLVIYESELQQKTLCREQKLVFVVTNF